MGQGIQDHRLSYPAGSRSTYARREEPVPGRRQLIVRSFRSGYRSVVLSLSLLEVLLRFAFLYLRHGGDVCLRLRALWLHRACSMIARRLSMKVTVSGVVPLSGLIAANHLSYFDILFFSSQLPCIFVSKFEVLSWPVFG